MRRRVLAWGFGIAVLAVIVWTAFGAVRVLRADLGGALDVGILAYCLADIVARASERRRFRRHVLEAMVNATDAERRYLLDVYGRIGSGASPSPGPVRVGEHVLRNPPPPPGSGRPVPRPIPSGPFGHGH